MTTRPPRRRLLAFDVGNTSVKCAVLDGGTVEPVVRVATRPTADLAQRLRHALDAAASDGKVPKGVRCVVSCVCPAAAPAVSALCEGLGMRAEFLGRDLPVPIPTRIPEPGKVGVDRLLLALGAVGLAGAPCIVVSAGTAITVDLVDADGAFAGGAIAPGFGLCARALHEGTALLPLVEPAVPEQDVGADTPAALRSGIYRACAGGVLGLIVRYRGLAGCASAPVVVTGTDAHLLLPALPDRGTRHAPDLIFAGMAAASVTP